MTLALYNLTINDKIEKYISDDDIYPMIIGKKYVYILTDMKYCNRSLFPIKIDINNVYKKYYGKTKRVKHGKKYILEYIETPINIIGKIKFKKI